MRSAAAYKAKLAAIGTQVAEALAEGNSEITCRQILAQLRFVVPTAANAYHAEEMRCDDCGVYLQKGERTCVECGRKHA